MPKTRQQKGAELEVIAQRLNAKGVVFATHTGLKVLELEELRKNLRQESAELVVTKRKLLLRALADKGITVPTSQLTGAIAVISGDDEVTPAKVVATFRKKHAQVTFVGGLLESAYVDSTQVTTMAQLPSKTELLAQAVGSIAAPLSGMVNVLAGNLRGLVNVLNAIKDKKPA